MIKKFSALAGIYAVILTPAHAANDLVFTLINKTKGTLEALLYLAGRRG